MSALFVFGLLVRTAATAGVVILVALVVARSGPRIGGIAVGLPIVLAPGFFFLGIEQPPAFVAEAAIAVLYTLAASLAFTAAYLLAAARLGPFASLGVAAATWLGVGLALAQAPRALAPALLVYGLALAAALALARVLRLPPAVAASRPGPGALALRGLAAGLLVALATTAGASLGPTASGLLIGYPVGITIVSLTLYQLHGAALARATVAAAQPGMMSLAAFAATTAAAAVPLGAAAAWSLALLASLAASGLMLTLARLAVARPAARHG
ncbi:hypothetical protein SH611_10050 (plasmid) [Geminicoccaceae bacterium 1502E]|nr:hypothetical protein [Geminicoccaceae bacterium 1502E]